MLTGLIRCVCWGSSLFLGIAGEGQLLAADAERYPPTVIDATPLLRQGDAERAALCWLDMVDNGDYRQSWIAAGDLLKCRISSDRWRDWLREINCGRRIETRNPFCSEIFCNPRGLPPGKYCSIRYESYFEGCCIPYCEEIVLEDVCERVGNRRWKVIYYKLSMLCRYGQVGGSVGKKTQSQRSS